MKIVSKKQQLSSGITLCVIGFFLISISKGDYGVTSIIIGVLTTIWALLRKG